MEKVTSVSPFVIKSAPVVNALFFLDLLPEFVNPEN